LRPNQKVQVIHASISTRGIMWRGKALAILFHRAHCNQYFF